jgi:hypothetical protein
VTAVAVIGVMSMRKRLSASQSSSFNEASKACSDQIVEESDNAPTDAPVTSAVPAEP